MKDSHLEISRLCVTYPGKGVEANFIALQDVNLSVRRGEFLTVVGPSGCGKSTLLTMIAALLTPSSGRVALDGRTVTKPGPDRAMVFQDYALLPWRSVLANVELALELQRVSAPRRREIARRYIAMVGLQRFENSYPHQLSGGMRQRVGIARALCVDPAVLLMDEPFGALDAQIRQVMGSELLRIWERDRKTILFVTHDIDEAVYLGDRVAVMSSSPGRIIQDIEVDLPRPRQLDIRNTEKFTGYREKIWKLLEQQVRMSGAWMTTNEPQMGA